MIVRTKYNYVPRVLVNVYDPVTIDVVDTSVDNVKDNVSVAGQSPSQSFFTNSDVPTPLYGPGITATKYDPFRHRGVYSPQPQANTTAAAAPSDSAAAGSAAAAAAVSQSSSNSQSVQ